MCAGAFLVGLLSYDYQPYEPEEDRPASITEGTLGELDGSPVAAERVHSYVSSMPPARVDGEEYPQDWVDVDEDGTMSARGRIGGCEDWVNASGDEVTGVTLGVFDDVGGVECIHGIPLVATADTRVTVDGGAGGLDLLRSAVLPQSGELEVSATFAMREGWFEALSIEASRGGGRMDCPVGFDFSSCPAPSGPPRGGSGRYWLEAEERVPLRYDGRVESLSEIEGQTPWFSLVIPDSIGSSPIFHQVDVLLEEGVPDSFDDWVSAGGDGCTFTAELVGGRLAFVGPAARGSE